MTKTQTKVRSALSVLIALTLALALAPFASAGKAYAEEGDGQAEQNTGTQETNEIEAAAQDAAVSSADDQAADSQEGAPQKEEGTVIYTPSAEDMEKSMIGLDQLSAADSGISSLSLDADARASANTDVLFFGGLDRVETSVLEAKSAFPSADYAIIAGSDSWPDALAASGLAGLYDCPIMLTQTGSLDSRVKAALTEMGVKHVFILGDQYSISDAAAKEIKDTVGEDPVRLKGNDRFGTQMAIYEYGLSNPDGKMWQSDLAVVANGGDSHFADALSASSGAFAKKAPVFLVQDSGSFSDAQKTALSAGAGKGLFKMIMVAGDTNSVSKASQSYLEGICPGGASNVVRRGGDSRYETSALIAEWMVQTQGLSWDNAAFTTGELAYDALGGGAAQGRVNSVVLLIGGGNTVAADTLIKNKGDVNTSIRFYGGYPSIPVKTRTYIATGLGISMTASIPYDITLDDMVAYEAKHYGASVSADTLRQYLDPANVQSGNTAFYQYADIGQGYTGLFTADQLDTYIASMASIYWEGQNNVKSKLRGTGQAIIDAAKKYNINEVYLLCHAGLESAWGCSNLAQGKVSGYEGYYNFYGIAAYDSNPEQGGGKYARDHGWDTPAKAIDGAAAFLSKNYIHDASFAQNTLYNMKWDLFNAIHSPDSHYEYATDVKWAQSIGTTMSSMYTAHGLNQSTSGLVFLIPEYK